MMSRPLAQLRSDWERWAASIDHTEDGWESDFPAWPDLLQAAIAVMTAPSIDADDLRDLAFCWAISEEDESLAAYAAEHLARCWPAVTAMTQAAEPAVRWQAYSVLGAAGVRAEPYLRSGLDDPDPYCRRRALLVLAVQNPDDAADLAQRFLSDPDPYLRLAALEMARVSGDPAVVRRAREQLAIDDAPFLRAAATTPDSS
jgi:hypothetical protein